MPDINLLKNTEKYDPIAPKPLAPTGPGPLSDPELEPKGLGGAFRSLFSRRPKMVEPALPVLGKALSGAGKMSLGKTTTGERILNEKKSRPTMIQLPEEEEGGFNINLLGQDVNQTVTLRRQLMKLVMVAVGACIAVAAMYFGLVFYNGTIATDISDTQAKINTLRSETTQLEKTQRQISETTKKITAIRSLIDRHVHWSKFFSELEKTTSPEVFYGTSFAGDLNGAVTLSARAPSFDAVATQYLYFQQAAARGNFILGFTISGATAQSTKTGPEVTFTVSLTISPAVFYETAADISATTETTPTIETETPTTNTNLSVTP